MKTLPEAIAAARAGQKSALRCPNAHGHKHGDRNPSLSVFPGKNSWVGVNCFSGCNLDDILAAAGLKVRDLGPDRPFEPRRRTSRPRISFLLPPPPPPPADDPEKVAKRRLWPQLMVPELALLERINSVRKIPIGG